ncbi:unnamed protein product, partial [Didymodactylos carnosus]
MIYMILRHLNLSWRDTDQFLSSFGTIGILTCHKWAKTFLCEDSTIFNLIRSIESCRLDIRRWGERHEANSNRPYFEGHERADICLFLLCDNAPFFSKGRGRSHMLSDFLVLHPSSPFFRLNQEEWNEATKKYPELLQDSDITYEKHSASAAINIGGDLYMDNSLVL